ncbi:MAG: hypothetical protein E6J41_28445 [Chloroflexi bacterium]|nr:MAG: hypothetical protein E6J41_28445 [Chloroflexota bacterium]
MTAAQPELRGTDWRSGTTLEPGTWHRLLQAFDAGAPPLLACQYAGVRFETWLAECRRTPEFELVAQRVRASGAVACLLFIQQTAATDWRVASEFLKVAFAEHFGSRARDVSGVELVGDEDPEAEVSPDDVAAVLRILRANGLGRSEVDLGVEVDGGSNGRANGAHRDGEAAE